MLSYLRQQLRRVSQSALTSLYSFVTKVNKHFRTFCSETKSTRCCNVILHTYLLKTFYEHIPGGGVPQVGSHL